MPTGKIKWYNAQKGYGFITPDVQGPDVFVHASSLAWAAISTLTEGQRLTYEVRFKDAGKIAATNIKLVESEVARCD
jgi:cold shock protein